MMGLWDPKDHQDPMDRRDPLEPLVFLVHLASLVFLEHQLVHPDVMVPWDPLDLPEIKVALEMLDHPGPLVSLVPQVNQLPPVVPPHVLWSVLTHASDLAHRHVAAKYLLARERPYCRR